MIFFSGQKYQFMFLFDISQSFHIAFGGRQIQEIKLIDHPELIPLNQYGQISIRTIHSGLASLRQFRGDQGESAGLFDTIDGEVFMVQREYPGNS